MIMRTCRSVGQRCTWTPSPWTQIAIKACSSLLQALHSLLLDIQLLKVVLGAVLLGSSPRKSVLLENGEDLHSYNSERAKRQSLAISRHAGQNAQQYM